MARGIGPGNPGVGASMGINSNQPRPLGTFPPPPPPPPPPIRLYQEGVFIGEFQRPEPLEHDMTTTYIGTFGAGHKWAGHYIEIKEYDEQTARVRMQQIFGSQWCAIYTADPLHTAEDNADVKKLGYKKITNDMLRVAMEEEFKPFNVIEGVL